MSVVCPSKRSWWLEKGRASSLFAAAGLMCGLAFGLTVSARAQPYCAVYDDDTQNCGIPTFQSCLQSLAGMGGRCTPDLTSQLRPDFIPKPRLFNEIDQELSNQPPPAASPADTNWMPPPPGQ